MQYLIINNDEKETKSSRIEPKVKIVSFFLQNLNKRSVIIKLLPIWNYNCQNNI